MSSLTKEASTKSPRSGTELAAGGLLRRASSRYQVQLDQCLAPFEVTASQFQVLKILAESQTSTFNSIAGQLDVDMAAVTRLGDRLEKRGLVLRRRCTQDRRVCFLELTEEGNKLIPQLAKEAAQIHESLFKPLSKSEEKILNSLLEKLCSKNGELQ